ncbi:MAG: hypothetical protein IH840_04935 [Candidatus Heimdallarchaeota archaeon]|nr:hypothetical protein [Candidatus Heimdallarchaeota archaeon]
MKCPDCSNNMKKHGAFYTCQRCGLSFKPWEVEQAQQRAKTELKKLEDTDPIKEEERRRRKLRKYRNWYEGRQELD